MLLWDDRCLRKKVTLAAKPKGEAEEAMMSQQSKKELLEVVRERYVTAKRKEKKRILDELVAATGYHLKHAIRVLRQAGGKDDFESGDAKRFIKGKLWLR